MPDGSRFVMPGAGRPHIPPRLEFPETPEPWVARLIAIGVVVLILFALGWWITGDRRKPPDEPGSD